MAVVFFVKLIRKRDRDLGTTRRDSQKGEARRSGSRNGRGRHDVRVQSSRAAHGQPYCRTAYAPDRLQHTDVHWILHHVHIHNK